MFPRRVHIGLLCGTTDDFVARATYIGWSTTVRARACVARPTTLRHLACPCFSGVACPTMTPHERCFVNLRNYASTSNFMISCSKRRQEMLGLAWPIDLRDATWIIRGEMPRRFFLRYFNLYIKKVEL
jgi:hypothetical protein